MECPRVCITRAPKGTLVEVVYLGLIPLFCREQYTRGPLSERGKCFKEGTDLSISNQDQVLFVLAGRTEISKAIARIHPATREVTETRDMNRFGAC